MPSAAARTHDRESIVDAALRILDAHGLPDLTMRRLAADLDVRPSAIYWHIESKQVLLAAVADRIVAEADAPIGADAQRIAEGLRDALLNHRDGADVVLGTVALSLGASAPMVRLEEALADTADPERSARILVQFVLGHTSLVQQRRQAAELGVIDADPRLLAEEAARDFRAGVAAIISGVTS